MQLEIRDCPACGAAIMDDADKCAACGQDVSELNAKRKTMQVNSFARRQETKCPKCGMQVPSGVLRCRDCGAYMSPEIEQAARAKQAASGLTTPVRTTYSGGFTYGSSAPPSGSQSHFTEVADDADFDIHPEAPLTAMQELTGGSQSARGGAEGGDDFELSTDLPETPEPGTATVPLPEEIGSDDYAVSAPKSSEPATPPAQVTPLKSKAGDKGAAPGSGVSHSVQTAGDVLLDAAISEEEESARRQKMGSRRRIRRGAAAEGSFTVYCPNGHRIQVADKHRGRTGKCPNCRSPFFVPQAEAPRSEAEAPAAEAGAATAEQPAAASKTTFEHWIEDIRLHRVNPLKLKLKKDSVAADYSTTDIAASPNGVLLSVVFSGGGSFRAGKEAKQKPENRKSVRDHLSAGLPVADLPVAPHYEMQRDELQILKIIQPTMPGEESMFADVPVFGEGRIVVRTPAADSPTERAYLSFSLSQFRRFVQTLEEVLGLTGFGEGTIIPLTDDITEMTCHYSDQVLRVLPNEKLVFYQADPDMKVATLGHKCTKCGVVLSEDSRKKEKVGGKADASVAKARCPKCKQLMGSGVLVGIKEA
jgi:uncharacterized protein with PIN domain